MQLNTPVGAGRREVAGYREKLRDFRTLEVTTNPNEHIRLLGKLAEPLSEHLLGRPLTVVELTKGVVLTCDEPIVTFHDQEDTPDPVIPQARQRARSRRRQGQREVRRTRLSSRSRAPEIEGWPELMRSSCPWGDAPCWSSVTLPLPCLGISG